MGLSVSLEARVLQQILSSTKGVRCYRRVEWGPGRTDGAVEVLGVLEEEAHHHRHPLAVLGLGDAEHLRDQRRLPDPALGMRHAVAARTQQEVSIRVGLH